MKKIYTFFAIIFFGFSVSAFSDELKIGYGKFDEGSDINENYMTEITYVYDGRNLPYGLQPIAGALEHGSDKSGSDAYMIYAGVQKKFKYKRFGFIPSLAPGYYNNGVEKDLGYDLQFKSQIELTIDLFKDYTLSYAMSHISNADLGDTNPGSDNQMFFITKKF